MITHNIILYGPPGTGKTYRSTALAVQLLENLSDADFHQTYPPAARGHLRKKAEQYRREGRLSWVIFHPSFSYEDFVEGIKPQSNEQKLLYEVVDGVFKQLCIRAAHALFLAQQKHILTSATPTRHDFDTLFFEFVDYLKRTTADDTQEIVFESKTGKPFYLSDINKNSTLSLRMGSGKKDYAVTKNILAKLYQKFSSAEEIKNLRRDLPAAAQSVGSIAWAVFNRLKAYEATRNQTYRSMLDATDPTHSARYQAMKRDIRHLDYASLSPEDYADAGNFVLVIDEINRGNVAAIFGELIALLEDDKRAGQPEALHTMLPYSRETFAVPPNLFVVGTMNTADRSVDVLDTALRRRFIFEEMPPTPELLSPVTVSVSSMTSESLSETKLTVAADVAVAYQNSGTYTVDLEKLLQAVNRRLTALLDADHQIGHGYLLPVMTAEQPLDALRSVMYHKIIPLLQEYFFNALDKVILIVGHAFFTTTNHSIIATNFFATSARAEEWSETLAGKQQYRLRELTEEELVGALREIYVE